MKKTLNAVDNDKILHMEELMLKREIADTISDVEYHASMNEQRRMDSYFLVKSPRQVDVW